MLSIRNIRKIASVMIIICCVFNNMVYATNQNIENNVYTESNLQYEKKDENGNLKIYSEAAILIEKNTGEILYEKNAYDKKYPASTTKILTAILVIEKCDLNEIATASEYAVKSVKSGYTSANIQIGESFTVEQLLEVMMLQSANEAANILAEHVSGSIESFTKLMNQKAKEIGCQNTHFINANGAHQDNHYSTAYDMAQIASYCMKNETFQQISNKMECSLEATAIWQEPRVFRNTNSLMNQDSRYYYPYCTGLKTGFTTPAKNCLIATSNKDGFELISVILHAETTDEGLSARYLDTINLLNYGYKYFSLEDIQEEYDLIAYVDNSYKSMNDFTQEENQLNKELEDNGSNDEVKLLNLYKVIIFCVAIIIFGWRKRVKKCVQKIRKIDKSIYNFKYDI